MTIGLACGTGYIGYAALFLTAVELITLLFYSIGKSYQRERERIEDSYS